MMSEMVDRVMRAMDRVVFQVGGQHGMTWQIVWPFAGPNSSDRIMHVGHRYVDGDSLQHPNADMAFEMRRCKARAAIEAMQADSATTALARDVIRDEIVSAIDVDIPTTEMLDNIFTALNREGLGIVALTPAKVDEAG